MNLLGHYRQWTTRERILSTFALCLIIVAAYSIIFSGPEAVANPEIQEDLEWSEQRVRGVLTRRGNILSDEWKDGTWNVEFRPTSHPIHLEELLRGSPLKSVSYDYKDEEELYRLAFAFPPKKVATYSPKDPESENESEKVQANPIIVQQKPSPQKPSPQKTAPKNVVKQQVSMNPAPPIPSKKAPVKQVGRKDHTKLTEKVTNILPASPGQVLEKTQELKLSELNLSTQYTTLLPAPHVVDENQVTLLVREAPDGVEREAILDWDPLEEGQGLSMQMDFSILPEEILALSLGRDGTIIETRVDSSKSFVALNPQEGQLFGVKAIFPKKGIVQWNINGPAILMDSTP